MFGAIRLAMAGAAVLAASLAAEDGWRNAVERGKALCAEGRFAEAEAELARIIEDGAPGGAGVRWTASACNNLGVVRQSVGNHADAERCYKRSIALWQQAPEAERVAGAGAPLLNLGLLCVVEHRYGEADKLFHRALEAQMKTHGPEHPDVATVLLHMGSLDRLRGRYDEAEALLLKAREMSERSGQRGAPQVASCWYNLGLLEDSRGDPAAAAGDFERAIGLWQKTAGPEHPDLAFGLAHLGAARAGEGLQQDAERLFKRALGILEKMVPRHPDIAWVLTAYARTLRKLDRKPEAEGLERRAARIRERHAAEDGAHLRVDVSELSAARRGGQAK